MLAKLEETLFLSVVDFWLIAQGVCPPFGRTWTVSSSRASEQKMSWKHIHTHEHSLKTRSFGKTFGKSFENNFAYQSFKLIIESVYL